MTVVLNSIDDFTLESLRRVAWEGEAVSFGEAAVSRMRQARRSFLAMIERVPDLHVYGVTTGYGDRAKTLLSPEEREQMAKMPAFLVNTGIGALLPERAVRAMIFTRLINYVSGHAAVSLETAEAVADMLDGRPLPKVPLAGMDSPGELLQLYSLYHHLMGEMSQPRDQNALRNGSGCAPGLLGDAALRARRRARVAGAVFALSADAANFSQDPWDPDLKPLIKDAHECEAIDLLQGFLAGGEALGRARWQPPISWRSLTRMLGHMLRTVALLEEAATTALSAVSDNPVFFDEAAAPPHGRVVSTGGFHVPSAYHGLNWMAAAWVDLAAIAARQVEQIHKGSITGLPDRLWTGGSRYSTWFLSLGAYEVANRAREQAVPALIPLYPGNDGQTDIVMPLFQSYEKEGKAGQALGRCLAILAASASQALHVAERAPAPPLRAFLEEVRRRFPVVRSARDLGAEIEGLATALDAAICGELQGFGLLDEERNHQA